MKTFITLIVGLLSSNFAFANAGKIAETAWKAQVLKETGVQHAKFKYNKFDNTGVTPRGGGEEYHIAAQVLADQTPYNCEAYVTVSRQGVDVAPGEFAPNLCRPVLLGSRASNDLIKTAWQRAVLSEIGVPNGTFHYTKIRDTGVTPRSGGSEYHVIAKVETDYMMFGCEGYITVSQLGMKVNTGRFAPKLCRPID